MNRPIKFRGRDLVGKMRFGHYATTGGYPYIIEGGVWCEVEPDSVAQLVGYDKNGAEVYEGDTVIRYDDEEEFVECPENGKLCTVIFYTQVVPDLNDYYCLLKEDTK